jgi:hypothetical protein
MLAWPILARLGVPFTKTASVGIARWSTLFIEDQIISMELAPGVDAQITLDFDNEAAEQTFLLAFLVNAGATAWSIKNVAKAGEAYRAAQAAYLTARQAGASRTSALVSSRAAGKGVGFVLGKVFLVDTAIWVGTMSIDGILNFFMEEEDQGWFSEMYGGWSPLGEAFTRLFEWIWPTEEAEDPIEALIQAASDEPTLAAAVALILDFYLENYPQVEILVNSEEYTQANLDASWFALQESFAQPAEVVWEAWLELMIQAVVIGVGIKIAWRTASLILYGGTESANMGGTQK